MVKYFYAFRAYWVLAFDVWLSGGYTRRILAELEHAQVSPKPEAAQIGRIHYYLIQVLISVRWACTLRGWGLTPQEKRDVILLGAVTPLVDDYLDENKMLSHVFRNGVTGGKDAASYLYRELMRNTRAEFAGAFEAAFEAQDASLAQLGTDRLEEPELRRLTANKGAAATLLYRIVLHNELSLHERAALVKLGYVLQLVNDAFDVYKDLESGQQTLVTNSANIRALRREFKEAIEQCLSLFLKTNFNRDRLRHSLMQISVITSRGLVCFDQLCRLASADGTWRPRAHARYELICDMEKPGNLKASFLYSVSFFERLRALETELKKK